MKELKCVRNFYVQLCLLSCVLCTLQYNEFTIGWPSLPIRVFHAKDYGMITLVDFYIIRVMLLVFIKSYLDEL
jgi:hypothetical protein